MRKLFKYDVAISVAEEDKDVAKQIITELKKKRISYYYYEDDVARSWGQYIINLTKDAYGKHARYVLIITSRIYVEKYWSSIELQIAVSNMVKDKEYVLPLRLDNTPIDGVSKHLVYLDWKDNPEEIARILRDKIRMEKWAEWRAELRIYLWPFVLIIIALIVYFKSRPVPRSHLPAQKTDRIRITEVPTISSNENNAPQTLFKRSIDTFYISNTEVTVAQYRQFCDSQKKSFPPQPPSSYEDGPVRNVTWYEARDYCKWVHGRLPTEEEWQYAASAGLAVRYSGGNSAGKYAVYNKQKPLQVGSREPNPFKLYDMTGNVAEWCDNWFDSTCIWKAVRGGSYNSKINPVNELDLKYRTKEHPDIRSPYIGFRVAWNNH